MNNQKKSVLRCLQVNSFEQINSYIVRQQFTLQSLPHCKITSIKNNMISLKVEVLTEKLIRYLKNLQIDTVSHHFLETTINTCEFLYSKYGCFAVSDNNLSIDSDNRPKIWIHEDPTINKCQLPLPNTKSGLRAMIKSILALFKFCVNSYDRLIKIDNFEQLRKQLRRLSIFNKDNFPKIKKTRLVHSTIFENNQTQNNTKSCKDLKAQLTQSNMFTFNQYGFGHNILIRKNTQKNQRQLVRRNQIQNLHGVLKSQRQMQCDYYNTTTNPQRFTFKPQKISLDIKKKNFSFMHAEQKQAPKQICIDSLYQLKSQEQSTMLSGSQLNSNIQLQSDPNNNNILQFIPDSFISKNSFNSTYNEQVQNELNELFSFQLKEQSFYGDNSLREDLQKQLNNIF